MWFLSDSGVSSAVIDYDRQAWSILGHFIQMARWGIRSSIREDGTWIPEMAIRHVDRRKDRNRRVRTVIKDDNTINLRETAKIDNDDADRVESPSQTVTSRSATHD